MHHCREQGNLAVIVRSMRMLPDAALSAPGERGRAQLTGG